MQNNQIKTEGKTFPNNTWVRQPQQQSNFGRPLRKRKPYVKPVFSAKVEK